MPSTARAFGASSEPAWADDARAALAEIEALQLEATAAVRRTVSADGALSAELIEREQHAAHGLAWLATYVQAIREMLAYRDRLSGEGRFGETEDLLTRIGVGEFLAQIFGGIPMSQGEIVRLGDFGLGADVIGRHRSDSVERLIATGNTALNRKRLAGLIDEADAHGTIGDPGTDETLEAMRGEIRRYAEAEVLPHAHEWHRKNEYI